MRSLLLLSFVLTIIACSEPHSSTPTSTSGDTTIHATEEQPLTPQQLDSTIRATDSLDSVVKEQEDFWNGPLNDTLTSIDKNRKLRHIYYANGGVFGFFNDGSVSTCPRCDFNEGAVAFLYKAKPYAKYHISNGSIVLNGDDVPFAEWDEDEETNKASGWAMRNYKWRIKPPEE